MFIALPRRIKFGVAGGNLSEAGISGVASAVSSAYTPMSVGMLVEAGPKLSVVVKCWLTSKFNEECCGNPNSLEVSTVPTENELSAVSEESRHCRYMVSPKLSGWGFEGLFRSTILNLMRSDDSIWEIGLQRNSSRLLTYKISSL